jgi:beta-glucanase (GH16 family)
MPPLKEKPMPISRLLKPLVLPILLLGFSALMQISTAAPDGWKLVWSDEFNGASIDRTKWTFDKGNGFPIQDTKEWVYGWGNNELEFYTDRPENAYLKDGQLHIRAIKEHYDQFQYTSARMITKGLFGKTYGRFEIRAKLPLGRGLWPALWLLPVDASYGIWASSGEIDMVEARGQEPNRVLGTLHYGGRFPANVHSGANYDLPNKGSIGDFHTYTFDWEPGVMRWYVDDKLYSTKRWWWSSSKTNNRQGVKPQSEADYNPWPAPFDKPFYLVMNLSVGGKFLGDPNEEDTTWPAEMVVDYVRVYDKAGGYGPVQPPVKEEPKTKAVSK